VQPAICWNVRVSRTTHRDVRSDVYDSDNVTGADNQQGSPLAFCAMTPQRPHAGRLSVERRRYGPGLAATQGGGFAFTRLSALDRSSSNSPSEIPCRVNQIARAGSDPGEQPANNGGALLVRDASRTS
jgi:hypothetical protein